MRRPNLVAALLAVSLVLISMVVIKSRAHRMEEENESRVAGYIFEQKLQGSALQRLAFKMHRFLPLYGSSELRFPIKAKAGDFFVGRPTGFMVFAVGRGGTTPLVMLQDLAAAGNAVEGHKVVLVMSPGWFMRPLDGRPYSWNASPLHAGSVVFGDFSEELKRDVARRLVQFPNPLRKSVLLQTAVRLQAGGTQWQMLLARLLNPLGQIWLWVLDFADDLETDGVLVNPSNHFKEPPPPEREPVDWAGLEENAEGLSDLQAVAKIPGELGTRPAPASLPQIPPKTGRARPRPPRDVFSKSDVWADYELLLRMLHECGARPLILSIPLDGPKMDRANVPYTERRKTYYDRLRAGAARYGFPVITFEEHEYDGNFLINHNDHPTEKGWLFFDEIIDAFYHDKIQP